MQICLFILWSWCCTPVQLFTLYSRVLYSSLIVCLFCAQGVVVKFNANQRYATNAITTTIIREVASKSGVPLQVRLSHLYHYSTCAGKIITPLSLVYM